MIENVHKNMSSSTVMRKWTDFYKERVARHSNHLHFLSITKESPIKLTGWTRLRTQYSPQSRGVCPATGPSPEFAEGLGCTLGAEDYVKCVEWTRLSSPNCPSPLR